MRIYSYAFVFANVLLVAVVVLLPLFNETGSAYLGNSVSDLGAQQTKGNWIVNGAIAFTSLITILYGSFVFKQQWLLLLALYFFGVSFGMTSVYQQVGNDATIQYDYTYDAIHALFIVLSQIAFTFLCLCIFIKVNAIAHRIQTIAMYVTVVILSILLSKFSEYEGLLQLLLYVTCFGWLFFVFTNYNFERHFTLKFRSPYGLKDFKKYVASNEK